MAADGYWNRNIGTVRTSNLSGYFTITGGDELCLEAEGGSMGRDSLCAPMGQTAPASDLVLNRIVSIQINLVVGLNFITFPLEPATPYTASGFAATVASQGGAVDQIDRWREDLGMWESYKVGLPFNDFTFEMGRAYFVKVTTATTWTQQGYAPRSVPLHLVAGLNAVGIPHSSTPLTASSLAAGIASQGGAIDQIDMWNESTGMWQSYKAGLPFNDFTIDNWRGYFLKATKASTFQP
jgi:hypothetical protein